jgi:hypothetical protein
MTGDMIRVTPELIEAGATSGVGFTVAQMRALGEYPRKGWRRRAIGKTITRDAAMAFLFAARRHKHRPLPGSEDHRAALAILERSAVPARRKQQPDALEELLAKDSACPICSGEGTAGPSVDATGRSIEREPCQLCAPHPRAMRDIAGDPADPPPWE